MQPPEVRYAKSGDVHLAYQIFGDGPFNLALIDQWYSNVEAQWDVQPLARFLRRLGSFSRTIVFDKRGTGLSDSVETTALPSLEEWMDDLRAVLDDADVERAALVGGVGAALMVLLFAATYPNRTSAIVLVDGYARMLADEDYPAGFSAEEVQRRVEGFTGWGSGGLLDRMAPRTAEDRALRQTWARYERQSASPSAAYSMIKMMYEADVRDVLPSIQCQTLVLQHAEGIRIRPEQGRYLAERIPGARYAELPGGDHFIWTGDQDATIAEIQEFLTGVRPAPELDRVLATVLFTDIVGSTDRASELGDRRWKELLSDHHRIVRAEIDRFHGREISTAGDGFLATFEGPARAIHCARAVTERVRSLGLEVRAGIHTGEIELVEGDIQGIAVHIGARVAAMAGPGEVLVSSTVKDLVAGSGITFEDHGTHQLKGVPGEWRLFAVTQP